MPIIHVKKPDKYSSISNELVGDKSLSWGARGLLVYLMSKPANWKVKTTDLIRQSPAGRDATLALLKELETARYLHRQRSNAGQGHFTWEIFAFESPAMNGFSVDGSTVDGKAVDVVKTESPRTESRKDSSPNGDAPSGKPKTEYILRSERMEQVFAEARGCPLPDWDNNPKEANKRWRTPLNEMLAEVERHGLQPGMVLNGIKIVVADMLKDKLTFTAPDQIKESFLSWLADQKGGSAEPAYRRRNLSEEYAKEGKR